MFDFIYPQRLQQLISDWLLKFGLRPLDSWTHTRVLTVLLQVSGFFLRASSHWTPACSKPIHYLLWPNFFLLYSLSLGYVHATGWASLLTVWSRSPFCFIYWAPRTLSFPLFLWLPFESSLISCWVTATGATCLWSLFLRKLLIMSLLCLNPLGCTNPSPDKSSPTFPHLILCLKFLKFQCY